MLLQEERAPLVLIVCTDYENVNKIETLEIHVKNDINDCQIVTYWNVCEP